MRHRGVVVVDLPFGPSLEDFDECNPSLHPRQCRAKTEVQTLSEGQMSTAAMDVETLCVREVPLIAVGSGVQRL